MQKSNYKGGELNSWNLLNGYKISELDIKLSLIKSVVMMAMFVKKLAEYLPNFQYLYEMYTAYIGKKKSRP
jgi:hypothetical protein